MSKIVEITRNINNVPATFPSTFRVGEPIMEGGHTVKEILYSRDGYNKGAKGHFGMYIVKFEESSEIRLISMDEVVDMAVVPDSPALVPCRRRDRDDRGHGDVASHPGPRWR